MKILVFFITLALSSAWAGCLKDPAKDYAMEFDSDPKSILYVFKESLGSQGPELILLADKSSCGARSCDYAGYFRDAQGCYLRAITFTGSFRPGPEKAAGLRSLIVTTLGEDSKRRSCEWMFRPGERVLALLPSTCRQN